MTQLALREIVNATLLATMSTACGSDSLQPTTTMRTAFSNTTTPDTNPVANPNTQAPAQSTNTNPPAQNSENLSGNTSSKGEQQSNKTCGTPPLLAKNKLNVQFQNLLNVQANLQSLDVYMPIVANPCEGVPVVIWVHGGAWMLGDKSNIDEKGRLFNSLGYGFVSVNYRLSPNLRHDSRLIPGRIQFPTHPTDVGAAVAWVHKNIKPLGGDPQKLALMGHSAGAHLAALVAMDQSYIQKADPTWNAKSLRCLGSYDTEAYNIVDFMNTTTGQPRLIYRNAFGDDANVWLMASPINHIKDYGIAVQLAQRGDVDRHAQLNAFKSALEGKKNRVSVINAQALSHEDVNRLIGVDGEMIITPLVKAFVTESCFPK